VKTFAALTEWISQRIEERNAVMEPFFAREAPRLAAACRAMSERFLEGGRLLAFGRGACATDAQHVSVEFVHPVIVGKRALPALDLSMQFAEWLDVLAAPEDMVMGFAPPVGDADVQTALDDAAARGAMTFALPGPRGAYAVDAPAQDAFLQQEIIEVLYHTLWETVHVFFEHRELGQEVGDAAFLYPFLGQQKQETGDLVEQVATSIVMKANDDSALRRKLLDGKVENLGRAAHAIDERLRRGGKLIVFGNGGSATDANDFALDCVLPPAGYRPIPAISLSMEPACLTAIANDVGVEVMFLRQLIAQARPQDVVLVLSTSGGSRNLLLALEEARKRRLLTVALLGYDGGEICRRGLADFAMVVRSDYIPRIQEVQATLYHTLRDALEVLRHASA